MPIHQSNRKLAMIFTRTKLLVNALLLWLSTSAISANLCSKEQMTQNLPANCAEALCFAGQLAESGIYQIRLPLPAWVEKPFFVYCLRHPQGGGAWTLVQRRQDATVNFTRGWNDYKTGFGNLNKNFFIGLDILHALTQSQLHELQIELRDFNDTAKYANYGSFAVGSEDQKYALNLLGAYSGDAGNSLLGYHDGQKFSTYDQDNDVWEAGNCAKYLKGGWWYNSCYKSSLNGVYHMDVEEENREGIIWDSFRSNYYSLKYAHMAIRPKQFECYNKS